MPREIIVAIFPSRAILTKALDRIKELDYLNIHRSAIVAKATSGETIVLNDDISPDEGGVAGGTLGAAMAAWSLAQLGALALPGVGPIIALGAGALVGGLVGRYTGRFAANLVDFGFKNEQVDTLATELEAGHPALVLELRNDQSVLSQLRDDLQPFRAELVERLREAAAAITKS
jgi:uncharacterized membrane protein